MIQVNMFKLVILMFLLQLFCKYGKGDQVYIIPSSDTPCPAQACYTLMQYINCTMLMLTLYQSSNVVLILMPGNHTLRTEFSITAKNYFSMSVYDCASSCTITCISSSRMTISSVDTVVISGLSFINCGGSTARLVNSFTLKDSNFIMDPQSYVYTSYYYIYRARAWSVIGSESLTVDGCTFIANTASRQGAALYISSVTNVIIALCTFNNNTASGGLGKGGAVYINAAITCIINGSTFFNNTLRGGGAEGGAMYVNAMNLTIYMSTFPNNTVRGGGAKGGALRVNATNSIITGTTFTNNTARGGSAEGGAVYVSAINSIINSTVFKYNTAQGGSAEGGALYIRARNSTIGLSTFINNSATHGAPQHIIANTSIISDDANYEGIQQQDLILTLSNNGICGENGVLVYVNILLSLQ